MVSCPKCSHQNCIKDGIIKEKQRYKCKLCGYRHTVLQRGKGLAIKRQALHLYLEGLGFRSIGRFLNCSHVAVYNWIKEFGESIENLKSDSAIKIVEIDEMHSYIASKKTSAGYGLLLIEMEKDLSIAYLGTELRQQERNFGTKSKEVKLKK